jgi:hypothetical protein
MFAYVEIWLYADAYAEILWKKNIVQRLKCNSSVDLESQMWEFGKFW